MGRAHARESDNSARADADASDDDAATTVARSPRRRLWKIVKWTLVSLSALLVVAVVAVWLVLANLNHPAVKSRLVALIEDNAGLAIDYDGLEVSLWSGVSAGTLTIKSPPKFASHAEAFVVVEGLVLDASLWSMPFGDLKVDSVRVGTVEVNVVTDETGATTISELFPSKKKPKEKKKKKEPTPRSKTLATLPSIEVGSLTIGAIRGRLIELERDTIARTVSVGDLAIDGVIATGATGLRGTSATIHTPPKLRVVMRERGSDRQALADLNIEVASEDSETASVAIALNLVEQDFFETTRPVEKIVALHAAAKFNPDSGTTSLNVDSLEVLDKALVIGADVVVPDGKKLSAEATATVAVDLPSLPIALEGVSLDALKLDVVAERLSYAEGRISGLARLAGTLAGAALDQDTEKARIENLVIDGSGKFDGPVGELKARVTLASTLVSSGEASAALESLAVDIDGATSEGTNGQRANAAATVSAESIRAKGSGRARADVTDPSVTATVAGSVSQLLQGAIDGLKINVNMAKLDGNDGGGSAGIVGPTTAEVVISNLVEAPSSLIGYSGEARVNATIASVGGRTGGDRVKARGVALAATAPLSFAGISGSIGLASAAFGPQSARGVDLAFELDAPLELPLEASGEASAMLTGSIGGFRSGEHRGGLPTLRALARKGGGNRYIVEVDATGASLVASGKAIPGRVVAKVRADSVLPAASKVDVSAEIRGSGGALINADFDASFDRRAGRLRYKAVVGARKLEAFATTLARVAPEAGKVKLAGARVEAKASGSFVGLISGRRGELPSIASDPLKTTRGEQSVDIELVGLDYREPTTPTAPTTKLKIPALDIKLTSVHRAGGAGRIDATVVSESIELEDGDLAINLAGLDETLEATFEKPPDRGVVKVASTLKLGSATQSAFPEYRVKDLSLVAAVEVDRLTSIFVRKLALRNPASGTVLTATGALEQTQTSASLEVETIPGREALTLEGRLTQKLDHLGTWGVAESAAGSVVVPFRLESGDMLSYRLVAKLMATNVSYVSSDRSFAVKNLNGVIPLVEELAVLPTGIVVIPATRASPLSRTRFFDVHPFLDSDDYITADLVTALGETFGPLAGNVRVSRSLFSIDQIVVGYRGGQVRGQVQAAYREGDPIVRMRLNITGVRPENSKDVLDANAAITFVPRTLSVDGKIQIVRISPEHLLDVLNILDPYRETVNVNKVRLGLKVGYPKFVRINMRDGALDAKVELGGAAKIVRIDEIKAVPLGPIMQIYVAPALAGLLPRQRSHAEPLVEREIKEDDENE